MVCAMMVVRALDFQGECFVCGVLGHFLWVRRCDFALRLGKACDTVVNPRIIQWTATVCCSSVLVPRRDSPLPCLVNKHAACIAKCIDWLVVDNKIYQ